MVKPMSFQLKTKAGVFQNERGSAIVVALLTLVVVTLIGIIASTTSRIETRISTSDVLYKMAFYEADGGTEITRELIEQNLSCQGEFPSSALNPSGELEIESSSSPEDKRTKIRVTNPDFSLQESAPSSIYPSDANRDIWFVGPDEPLSAADGTPHTNTVAFGVTSLSTGSAIQMAAGYSGVGFGAGAAGGQIVYEIHSRHEYRARHSESHVMVEYRHVIGQEGDCPY